MTDVIDTGSILIRRLTLGAYSTNAYIIICSKTGESLLVDAPAESGKILAALEGTHPRHIVITHNHFDHTEALQPVKSALHIPIAAHPFDAGLLPCMPDLELDDGDILNIGEVSLKVIHTPGHTPGSICLHTGKYLLAGDTIFPGGPGHTSSPVDFTDILRSITTKIIPMPADTIIYPGHGEPAVLANEKKAIAAFISRPLPAGLCGDVLWLSS